MIQLIIKYYWKNYTHDICGKPHKLLASYLKDNNQTGVKIIMKHLKVKPWSLFYLLFISMISKRIKHEKNPICSNAILTFIDKNPNILQHNSDREF